MNWTPHITVAAVIRRGDHYLMVEETPDGQPVLNQPAGHLEQGESLLDAVRREVLEETGHPFEPSALLGIYQWTTPDNARTYVRFCFLGKVGIPQANARLDADITATHWLTRSQILGGPLALRSPLVARCLMDTEAGRQLPLESIVHLG